LCKSSLFYVECYFVYPRDSQKYKNFDIIDVRNVKHVIVLVTGMSSVQTPISVGSTAAPGVAGGKPALRGKQTEESRVFDFGEARVREYLSSLSSNSSESGEGLKQSGQVSQGFMLSPVSPLRKKKRVEVVNQGEVQASRALPQVSEPMEVQEERLRPSEEPTLEREEFRGPMTRAKRRQLEMSPPTPLQPCLPPPLSSDHKRKRKHKHHHKSKRHRTSKHQDVTPPTLVE
jgi:hypothetical protein